MPVQKKVVVNWKFDCLGYETNAGNEVTLIFCKVCREFSKLENVTSRKKGCAKIASEKFVKGTSVIKKCNFHDHIIRSKTHAAAVLRLSDRDEDKNEDNEVSASSSSSSLTTPSGAPRQTTLMPFVQRLNALQRNQLVKKMQIAHFTTVNAKSFSFYGELSKFCKETLKVSFKNYFVYEVFLFL